MFDGRYQIVRFFKIEQRVNDRWVELEEYEVSGIEWQLVNQYVHKSFCGNLIYGGRVIEIIDGEVSDSMEFTFLDTEKTLFIDRSYYLSDGFCDDCVNDRYRFVKQVDNCVILYDLEGVDDESIDYGLRLFGRVF